MVFTEVDNMASYSTYSTGKPKIFYPKKVRPLTHRIYINTSHIPWTRNKFTERKIYFYFIYIKIPVYLVLIREKQHKNLTYNDHLGKFIMFYLISSVPYNTVLSQNNNNKT